MPPETEAVSTGTTRSSPAEAATMPAVSYVPESFAETTRTKIRS